MGSLRGSRLVTQRATESDDAGLPATLQTQEALGLGPPPELYTDGAYISGQAIQEAKEAGWQLVGPAQPSASRAGLAKEYRIEAFDISITERKALCPEGKTSTNCSKLTEEKSGSPGYFPGENTVVIDEGINNPMTVARKTEDGFGVTVTIPGERRVIRCNR